MKLSTIAIFVVLLALSDAASIRGVRRSNRARKLKKAKGKKDGGSRGSDNTGANSYWQGNPGGSSMPDLTQAYITEITIISNENGESTTISSETTGDAASDGDTVPSDGRDSGTLGTTPEGGANGDPTGGADVTFISVTRPDGTVSYQEGVQRPPAGTPADDNSLVPCRGKGCTSNSID